MKVAFLGKGGSGKSTLATACVKYLHSRGFRVLAIDADHNMDLSYNIGIDNPSISLGSNPSLIREHVGLPSTAKIKEVRETAAAKNIDFRLSPPDTFTAQTTIEVSPNLLLMVAGPHTDIVRSGADCSHSLAAPLKAYLPLLQLKDNEAVVIDERAGTDPVATGILQGVDLAVIVAEPTVHSVRVAKQIAAELTLANVPHLFVANKVSDDQEIFSSLPTPPVASISFAQQPKIEPVLEKILHL